MDLSKIETLDFNTPALPASGLKNTLVKLFLFFLPFSQALTINIGFPLKLSEIFLICLLMSEVVSGNVLKWEVTKSVLWASIFCFFILVSVVANIFSDYNYSLAIESARISPMVDSILKFMYVAIAILAFILTKNELRRNQSFIKWFFYGALVASIYAWYLFVSGMLRVPVYLLPGMDSPPQAVNVGSAIVIRCGTFKEGNYMGFFLLVAAIAAMYYKKHRWAIFFFLTIVTTLSTTSIFCAGIFFVFFLFKKYEKHKLKFLTIIGVVSIVLLLITQFSADFRTIVYNKLFADEDSVENLNDLYSKADRLNTATIGWNIFEDNPVLGVGLANYGLHYNYYNTLPELDVIDQAKRIPNNIYAEILSECGAFAFLSFLVLLSRLFKVAKYKSTGIFTSGLIACMVYFFAFPTFAMLFIWVFFGVIESNGE